MTTATLAAPTVVDVLNQKKRFAETLVSRDAARTAMDKVMSAPKAARAGLMSLLRTFKLDALAGVALDTLKSAYGFVAGKATWLWQFATAAFGWKVPLVYAVTDERARGYIKSAVAGGYLITYGVLGRVADVVERVPFIGKPTVRIASVPFGWLNTGFAIAVSAVEKTVGKVKDHWATELAHDVSGLLLVRQAINTFVPARFRLLVTLAYLFRPAKSVYAKVKADPAAAEVVEQVERVRGTAKAAAAAAQDVIIDRVLDGPRGDIKTTQPGTETMDIIVLATGKRHTVTVDIDTRGDKRIFWDGVYYDVVDLGQASTDPIAPLPIDPATRAMRLDQARADIEAKAAASLEAMVPATPATPPAQTSRAVARALGPQGKKRTPAKAGSRR